MPMLFGVTGYSGAGKTSAIEHIAARIGANRIYVGQLVADEVVAQGLTPGPDSERIVRVNLRERHGLAGMAILVAPAIVSSLALGRPVVIDAICSLDELHFYRTNFDENAILVSIMASFETRASRVAARSEKPLTR